MFCEEDFVWRKCKKDGADVWSEGFKLAKELEKKIEKLSTMFFLIMLLDVASGLCDFHRGCIKLILPCRYGLL